MGQHPNVGLDVFPKQGQYLGRRVRVIFNYDDTTVIGGEIVRDDLDPPGRTIIKLDNGRYVLGTECQWAPDQVPDT